jgi:hypothetical protein
VGAHQECRAGSWPWSSQCRKKHPSTISQSRSLASCADRRGVPLTTKRHLGRRRPELASRSRLARAMINIGDYQHFKCNDGRLSRHFVEHSSPLSRSATDSEADTEPDHERHAQPYRVNERDETRPRLDQPRSPGSDPLHHRPQSHSPRGRLGLPSVHRLGRVRRTHFLRSRQLADDRPVSSAFWKPS